MMEYKKPKLVKIKKIKPSDVKVAKDSPSAPRKVEQPAKMRLKRAHITTKGMGLANKPKKKQGKVTRIKRKASKAIQSDRVKQEIKNEQMASDMMKEAMEKGRIKGEMNLRKRIKRLK